MTKHFIIVILVALCMTACAQNVSRMVGECLTLPYSDYGFTADKMSVSGDIVVFDCHVNYESQFIKHYLKEVSDNELNDSLRQEYADFYNKFIQNGNKIDMSKINVLGDELFGDDCMMYVFFKPAVMCKIARCIISKKIENNLSETLKISLKIWNSNTLKGSKRKLFHTLTIDKAELMEAVDLINAGYDPFDVLLDKLAMLRGIDMNRKILPVDYGNGTVLTDIITNGNETIYKTSVSDFVAMFTSEDDYRMAIQQIKVGIEGRMGKKHKGFERLGMKITYHYYQESNGKLLNSFTYLLPSMDIIDVYPERLNDMLSSSAAAAKGIKLEKLTAKNGMVVENTQAVDLGLSSGTLWAGWNIGAHEAYQYGNYYAWGETKTKSLFTWDNYNGSSDEYSGAKYFQNGNYQYNIAGTDKDVASVLWKEKWAMPTDAQKNELLRECKWYWTELNGVAGAVAEGPNGNCIFLPAGGCYFDSWDGKLTKLGETCFYWTSDLFPSETYKGKSASCLIIWDALTIFTNRNGDRADGKLVRAVIPGKKKMIIADPVEVAKNYFEVLNKFLHTGDQQYRNELSELLTHIPRGKTQSEPCILTDFIAHKIQKELHNDTLNVSPQQYIDKLDEMSRSCKRKMSVEVLDTKFDKSDLFPFVHIKVRLKQNNKSEIIYWNLMPLDSGLLMIANGDEDDF